MDKIIAAKVLIKLAKEIMAMEFPTQEALNEYLKEHPEADKSHHSVKKTKVEQKPKETKKEKVPTGVLMFKEGFKPVKHTPKETTWKKGPVSIRVDDKTDIAVVSGTKDGKHDGMYTSISSALERLK